MSNHSLCLVCLSLLGTLACSKTTQEEPKPPTTEAEAAPETQPTSGEGAAPGEEGAPSEGEVGAARGVAPSGPARNPFLAADKYAVTHFDPAQTDSMPYPTSRGATRVNLRRQARIDHGPVNIMTLASTSPSHMWAVSSQGVAYVDVSNGGFREIARLSVPGTKVFPQGMLQKTLGRNFANVGEVKKSVVDDLGLDWTRIASGVYSVADRDNRVYYNTADGKIVVFGLRDESNPAAGIQVVKIRDFKPLLRGRELMSGLTMTYDGMLVVQTNGSISVLPRSLEGDPKTVRYAAGEHATNAAAVDEKNGIYVASDKRMRKLVWTGRELSERKEDGAWSAPYDTGRQPPTVKFGTGTGSTPTLMGFGSDPDKLVVITDGADRMKLVAFWRDEIPEDAKRVKGAKSDRIAGQLQVTCGLDPKPEFIQTEQSVVVSGYGAFVVNNVAEKGEKDKLVDVVALGPVNPPPKGMERMEWDPKTNELRSVWTRNDVVSTSMVPTTSVPSGMVFVNGYTKEDGWEVTGLDWSTGGTVHRTIFGHDNLGNGAYALIQLFPDGDLLFNSIAGPARIPMERSMVSSAPGTVPLPR